VTEKGLAYPRVAEQEGLELSREDVVRPDRVPDVL
jgi:hypothetical protein